MTKDALHRLVDELPEDQLAEAHQFLQDLVRGANSEAADEPLDPETLASLERGLEDIRAGRVKSLEQYEKDRGL